MSKYISAIIMALLVVVHAGPARAIELPLMLVPSIVPQRTVDGSSIVVVDPYIYQAQLFEDLNDNGTRDTGEQQSTVTDAGGQCAFTDPLTVGATLVMEAKGEHNGVPYTLTLKQVVEQGMTGDIVVSPLTTFLTESLTTTQVAQMLVAAGLSGVTAGMITEDPMALLATHTGAITDAELLRIQASIASYVFMRIREGSTRLAALSGSQLYASAMDTTTPGELNVILSKAVSVIQRAISANIVTQAQTGMASGLPDLVVMDIVQTAVTIADRLAYIGYSTCNATLDANNPAGTAANEVENVASTNLTSWIDELGMLYYGYRNRAALVALGTFSQLPQAIQDGATSNDGIWYITDANIVDTVNPPQD